MNIILITVGKVKTSWIAEGCELYLDRLKHSFTIEERVLKAGTAEEEHKKLLECLEDLDAIKILLDERGKQFSSPEFSALLTKQMESVRDVAFVIGGAYGFSDEIRKKADALVSLGKMTLPHELCTVVFLEQLFRADSIRRGSGYHHEG